MIHVVDPNHIEILRAHREHVALAHAVIVDRHIFDDADIGVVEARVTQREC